MADTTVMREFLVSLGYSVDESSKTKFVEAVTQATTRVGALGAAIEAAAAGILAFVVKTSEQLEKMYWASIRIGASAEKIQEFVYSMSQMGASASEAQSQVEGFAEFMRTHMGSEALVRGLLGSNYVFKDTVTTLRDIGKALADLNNYPLARTWANTLHLGSDSALQALMRGSGGYDAQSEAINKRLGLDMKAATEAGLALSRQWRETEEIIDRLMLLLGQRLATGGVMDELQQFNAYMLAHGDQISDTLLKIADDLLKLAKQLNDVIQSTVGWRGAIEGFMALMALDFVVKIVTPFAMLTGAIVSTTRALIGLGTTMSIVSAPAWLLTLLAAAGYGAYLGTGDRPYQGEGAMSREEMEEWHKLHSGHQGRGNNAPYRPSAFHPASYDVPIHDSTLTPQMKALLAAISIPESGGDYNKMYGGGELSDLSWHPGMVGGHSAAGRYQFLQSTWEDEARRLGLHDFGPASQDRAAADLASRVYYQMTGRDLNTDLRDPGNWGRIARALNKIWPSLPGGSQQLATDQQFNSRLATNFNRPLTPAPQVHVTVQAPPAASGRAPVVNQTINNTITTADLSGTESALQRVAYRANADLVRQTRSAIV